MSITQKERVYKGHNSPFTVIVRDYDGSVYSESDMEGITRAYLKYIPNSGATPEYADSGEAEHSDVFDWASLKADSKILIDLGPLDFTAGRDRSAELVVYDATYTEGRVIEQLDVTISDEAAGDI